MKMPRLLLACVGTACLVTALFPGYTHTDLENGGWRMEFRLDLPFSPLLEFREETVKQVIKRDHGRLEVMGLGGIALAPNAKAETTVSQYRNSSHVEFLSWSAALLVVGVTLLTVAVKPRVWHVARPAAGSAEDESRGPT
jgi:hypothetical protein